MSDQDNDPNKPSVPTTAMGGGAEEPVTTTASSQHRRPATSTRTRSKAGIIVEEPDLDMTIYKITGSQLSFLGFSGGIGSFLMGGAVYMYQRHAELKVLTKADPDLVAQTFASMWFLGSLAAACYIVFGGIIIVVKWSHGRRWHKLLT